MIDEVSADEYVELLARKKPSKYRNKLTEVDGVTFHSRAEAKHYEYLRDLQRMDIISELVLQPRFPIVVNDLKICTYIGDFMYTDMEGQPVVVDVKGAKTEGYRLKKKLMLAVHGIEIQEVTK